MRKLRIVLGSLTLACCVATGTAFGAAESVTCKDGTTAKADRGACSHHGGIAKTDETVPSTGAAQKRAAPAPVRTVTCADGTTGNAGRGGACSHHGGVANASTPASAQPSAAPAPKATAPAPAGAPPRNAAAGGSGSMTTDPTGATAHCKDGTYSHAKHHTGACSRHGGVAQWLEAQ
jgi:hypothetical protein